VSEVRLQTIRQFGVETDVLRLGAGPPLLFLHSNAAPDSHDSAYLELLAERFEVIAPFHPGFGRHARPAHFRGVDDIAYFYLDMLEALNLTGVTLVGASLGGWVAGEMTVRSTARLGRLVLVGAFGIKAGKREDRDFADFFAVSPERRAQMEFTDARFSVLSYAGKTDAQLTVLARGRESEAYYGWQPFMHNPQLIHWLHRIDIPTLLVRGAEDRIIDPANPAAYLARIPRSRMSIVEGAGHYPHLDRPQAFASAIHSFAGSIEKAAVVRRGT